MSESRVGRDHLITCGPSVDSLQGRHRLFSMMSSVPLVFRIFQVVIPAFAVIILCTGLCKCYLHSRRRRREQRQLEEASARVQASISSVYVIPATAPVVQQREPWHYGLTPEYASPPPYNELMAKPDYPHDPPPAYTESASSPCAFSESDPGASPRPPLPQ